MDHRFVSPASEAFRQLEIVIPISRIEFNQIVNEAIRAKKLDHSMPREILINQIMEICFRACAGTSV